MPRKKHHAIMSPFSASLAKHDLCRANCSCNVFACSILLAFQASMQAQLALLFSLHMLTGGLPIQQGPYMDAGSSIALKCNEHSCLFAVLLVNPDAELAT